MYILWILFYFTKLLFSITDVIDDEDFFFEIYLYNAVLVTSLNEMVEKIFRTYKVLKGNLGVDMTNKTISSV